MSAGLAVSSAGCSHNTGPRGATTVTIGAPDPPAIAGKNGWVPLTGGYNEVAQFDLRSNRVLRRIDLHGNPYTAISCGGFVWVSVQESFVFGGHEPALVKIRPRSGRIIDRIPLTSSPNGLACRRRAVWLIDDSGRVSATEAGLWVRDVGTSGRYGATIALGGGAAWVDSLHGVVKRIDLETKKVKTIYVGERQSEMSVVFGGGAAWASAPLGQGGVVARIDPGSGRITKRIRFKGYPGGMAIDGKRLWVALRDREAVLASDVAKQRIIGGYRVGHTPDLLSVGAGSLWVTYDSDLPPHDDDKLTRIPLSVPLEPVKTLPAAGDE